MSGQQALGVVRGDGASGTVQEGAGLVADGSELADAAVGVGGEFTLGQLCDAGTGAPAHFT